MAVRVYEKKIGLSSAVTLCGLIALSCNEPTIRRIHSGESFVQGQHLSEMEVVSVDDTDAQSESMTVTGTESELTFSESIQQGSDALDQVAVFGSAQSDSFTQRVLPQQVDTVDILLVLDNSASMLDENTRLAANFSSFLSRIAGINWRIAVTTTHSGDYGTIEGMIVKGQFSTAQQELAAFNSLILSATSGLGSSTELPIRNTIGVLLNNPQGFIRANAHFITIFVSDEDSCSSGFASISASEQINYGVSPYNGPARQGNPPTHCRSDWDMPQALLNVATTVKGSIDRVGFYGIFWVPGTPMTDSGAGQRYQANLLQFLVTQTGRFSQSVWDPDYASVLADIGDDISRLLIREFVLSYTPNPSSVVVRVNGSVISSSNYQIQGMNLVFPGSYVPPSGAQVAVNYYVGDAPKNQLVLSNNPIAQSLQARIDGQIINTYTFDAATRTLTFSPVPAAGKRVVVTYDIQPAVRVAYDVGSQDLPALNSVKVLVNQQALAPNAYSVSGSTVTLAQYPGPYASVKIKLVRRSTLGVTHQIAAQPVGTVAVYDGSTALDGSAFNSATRTLTLDRSRVERGKVYSIRYAKRTRDTRNFQMARPVMPDTMEVTVDGAYLDESDFEVNEKGVTFLNALPARAQVTFNYIRDDVLPRDFPLDAANISQIVDVMVNGVSASGWTWDPNERVIRFSETPKARSTIQVVYW